MPISISDLKDYATKLSDDSTSEVELRSSVSRAYYCAFHALMPFVSRLPKSTSCPRNVHHVPHSELLARLKEWNVHGLSPALSTMRATKAGLIRTLDSARALRVRADYELGGVVTKAEAKMQVERARLIIRHTLQIEGEIAKQAGAAASS